MSGSRENRISMAYPRVSIIIVSWNGLALLKRCLPSVAATSYPNLEILLADNASTDGTPQWVTNVFPEVRVVTLPTNLLFTGGNCAVWPLTTGKYVVLLNNDVETTPEWLTPLVNVMETNTLIAGVQPKLLDFTHRNRFEYAGAAGGFLDRLGYPFARGRLLDHVEPDHGQYDSPCDVDWGTGAALLLRKRCIESHGFLDERFEMHMEEIDLCWRLRRHGYRICAVPSSVVYHMGGASLAQGSSKKLYLNYRNNLIMLYKNLSAPHWRRVFPQRLLLDAAVAASFLVRGQWKQAHAIITAYIRAHRYCRDYTHAPENTALPSYAGSIFVDRYILGRRKYSTLPRHQWRDPALPKPWFELP